MEGNEIKDAAGTVLDLILQQGREREENVDKTSRKASERAARKPLERIKEKVMSIIMMENGKAAMMQGKKRQTKLTRQSLGTRKKPRRQWETPLRLRHSACPQPPGEARLRCRKRASRQERREGRRQSKPRRA